MQSPVEGTILTVAQAAADAASATRPSGSGLLEVLEAARQRRGRRPGAHPGSAAGPEGGRRGRRRRCRARSCLFDALLHVADGRPLPACPDPSADGPIGPATPAAPSGDDGVGLRYEVMYLLEAPDESIPPFRELWAGLGRLHRRGRRRRCVELPHPHRRHRGRHRSRRGGGPPPPIRVSDLWEQVEEERWVREAAGPAVGD